MKWTDVYDIAIELEEAHPDVEIRTIRFTDLWKLVTNLESFSDEPQNSSERVLEAIQAAWIEERE